MCYHPWSAPWCPQNSPSWSWWAWDCGWSCQSLCCSRLFGGRTTWVHSRSCSADFQTFSLSHLCCSWSTTIKKMHRDSVSHRDSMDIEWDLYWKSCLHKAHLGNSFHETCCLTNNPINTSLMYRQICIAHNTHVTNRKQQKINLEMSRDPSANEGDTRKPRYKI